MKNFSSSFLLLFSLLLFLHLTASAQLETKSVIAFNGWNYSARQVMDGSGTGKGYKIYRSKDGLNWQLFDDVTIFSDNYKEFDLAVTGTDSLHLYLWLAGINSTTGKVYVDKYDARTMEFLGEVFNCLPSGELKQVVFTSPQESKSSHLCLSYYLSGDKADSWITITSKDGGKNWVSVASTQ